MMTLDKKQEETLDQQIARKSSENFEKQRK